MNKHSVFQFNQRLGIMIPVLEKAWEAYTKEEQETILSEWEHHRGFIPDRIKALEISFMEKIEDMNQAEPFEVFCMLNDEISELASAINDLNIWYRAEQTKTAERRHQ